MILFRDIAEIYFNLEHTNESLADAVNLRIGFFLPPYVAFNKLINSTYPLQYTINGSAVFFTVFHTFFFYNFYRWKILYILFVQFPRLFIGQTIEGSFEVEIDPKNTYKDIVNAFGQLPPNELPIPYVAYFNKQYEYFFSF